MKLPLKCGLIFLALSGFSFFLAAQSITLTVEVKDSGTGAPVPSALVSLSRENTIVVSAYTDTGGNAELSVNLTTVENFSATPSSFSLSDNYPNPFSEQTNIRVGVDNPGSLAAGLYNILGQRIASERFVLSAGFHTINLSLGHLPAGMYFVRIEGSESKAVKLLKSGNAVFSQRPVFSVSPTSGASFLSAGKASAEPYILKVVKEEYALYEKSILITGNLRKNIRLERLYEGCDVSVSAASHHAVMTFSSCGNLIELEYGLTRALGEKIIIETDDASESRSLYDLMPEHKYFYKVYTVDQVGERLLAAAGSFTTGPSPGHTYHVTVDGSASGDGSPRNPWDIETALKGTDKINPGDIILIHGGTYKGYYGGIYHNGTRELPVIIRANPGDRVRLDAYDGESESAADDFLHVFGNNIWLMDIEFTSGYPYKDGGTFINGIGIHLGDNHKFINLHINNTGSGYDCWSSAVNAEIYGSIAQNVGTRGPTRGHGHGLYIQNRDDSAFVTANVFLPNFGQNFHAYTEGGYINNIIVRENLFAQGRAIYGGSGGSRIAENPRILSNRFYDAVMELGYHRGTRNAVVDNNTFYRVYFNGEHINPLITNNRFVSVHGNVSTPEELGVWRSDWNNVYYPAEGVEEYYVLPNKYEAGRANIIIYNTVNRKSAFPVNVGGLLEAGDRFEIRDAFNFFGEPVYTGVYDGGEICVPLTGLTPARVTAHDLTEEELSVFFSPHPAPGLGVFVIRKY